MRNNYLGGLTLVAAFGAVSCGGVESGMELAPTPVPGALSAPDPEDPATGLARYQSWQAIDEVMDELAEIDLFTVHELGRTHEGRMIRAVQVTPPYNTGITLADEVSKPSLLLECSMHAREWASSEMCIRLLQELADRYLADPYEIEQLLDDMQLWVIPVSNPDGRAFDDGNPVDFSDPTYRQFWRKNRTPVCSGTATGINLARNFSHDWTDTSTCSSGNFKGDYPFQGEETKILRRFVNNRMISLAVAIHSSGGMFDEVRNTVDNHEIAQNFADAWMANRLFATPEQGTIAVVNNVNADGSPRGNGWGAGQFSSWLINGHNTASQPDLGTIAAVNSFIFERPPRTGTYSSSSAYYEGSAAAEPQYPTHPDFIEYTFPPFFAGVEYLIEQVKRPWCPLDTNHDPQNCTEVALIGSKIARNNSAIGALGFDLNDAGYDSDSAPEAFETLEPGFYGVVYRVQNYNSSPASVDIDVTVEWAPAGSETFTSPPLTFSLTESISTAYAGRAEDTWTFFEPNRNYRVTIEISASSDTHALNNRHVFRFTTQTLNSTQPRCDFNGDGIADLAVGVPLEDINNIGVSNGGMVNIVYGTRDGLDDSIQQGIHQNTTGVAGDVYNSEYFSSSMACGDLNGDGYGDLVVGIPRDRVDGTYAGSIHMFFGSNQGLSTALDRVCNLDGAGETSVYGDKYGTSLAVADYDADGYDDIAVGVPGSNSDAGSVHVIYGSYFFVSCYNDETWDQGRVGIAGAPEAGDEFGQVLAAGDFNGDGYADIAIASPGEDTIGNSYNAAGAVNIIYGGDGGLSAVDNRIWYRGGSGGIAGSPTSYDRLGETLVSGDFDSDGFDDLAIGAPRETVLGHTRAGNIHLLNGSSGGLTYARTWSQASSGINGSAEAYDYFAASLAAGDVNGDGIDDLVVGTPYEDTVGNSIQNSGLVNIILGSTSGLTSAGDYFVYPNNIPGSPLAATAYDAFGFSLFVDNYDGDAAMDLAVGIPLHDTNSVNASGAVQMIYNSPSQKQYDTRLLHQDTDLHGMCESYDQFGVSLGNGAPRAPMY